MTFYFKFFCALLSIASVSTNSSQFSRVPNINQPSLLRERNSLVKVDSEHSGIVLSHQKPKGTIILQSRNKQNNERRIEGDGFSLVLPSSFHGGNPQTEIDILEDELGRIVPDASNRLFLIRNSPLPIVFFAFDSALDSTGFLTNINVGVENIPSAMSVAEYLQASTLGLKAFGYNILEEKVVGVNQISMGRIVGQKANIKQLWYLIPRGDRFYVVTYSSTTTDFSRYLPIFERSIQTVRF